MKKFKVNNENVVEVNSIQEALTIDTEENDIDIIILNNVSTKGNWKEAALQNHIPKQIADDSANYGKIIIRVGLGYHFAYDTVDKTWVKPLDTSTEQVIRKYIAQK